MKYYITLSFDDRKEIDIYARARARSSLAKALNDIRTILTLQCYSSVPNRGKGDPVLVGWEYVVPYDSMFEVEQEQAENICQIIEEDILKTKIRSDCIKKFLDFYNEVNNIKSPKKYQFNIEEEDIIHFNNILVSSLNSCTYLSKRGKELAKELLENIGIEKNDIVISEPNHLKGANYENNKL